MKKPLFKTWNQTEDKTWQLLVAKQLPDLQAKASQLWLDGFRQLELPLAGVPNFKQVSHTLQTLGDWRLVPTEQIFADGETWFQLLKQRQMLITNYIRPLKSLDYTPLPDVFHDAFGHLPFFANEQFRRIVSTFTDRILQASPIERQALGSIWWYTIEFGLIKEAGQMKILGAGLVSSVAERHRVFSDQVRILPFDPDQVAHTTHVHDQFHETLFLLESLDQFEDIAQNWTLHD